MSTSSPQAAGPDFVSEIARELQLRPHAVAAVIALFADGNTVPFVARYRKEATGGLDEVQIRAVGERQQVLSQLFDRKQTILESIQAQGQLTDSLRRAIMACRDKTALEDLYLPFKQKRRTRATAARERGLEPLANRILAQPPSGDPLAEASAFVDPAAGVEAEDDALAGARDIVAEVVAETATIRAFVRRAFLEQGTLLGTAPKKKRGLAEAAKFRDYFDYSEPVRSIPSHRFLALRRGERDGFLRVKIGADDERLVVRALRVMGINPRSPFAGQLGMAVEDSYKRLIKRSVSNDVLAELKRRADATAIEVFAQNLRHLLLAPPGGPRRILAVDPGLRTGCKTVALDETGALVANVTLFISGGAAARDRAAEDLVTLVERWRPFAVVVGNGTGGREAEAFARRTLSRAGRKDVLVVSVNESGASIYSASDLAREEFPDLDLTVRGAISIGRRFQDPLAELVKIDPKSIGVGQYQHDVEQGPLSSVLGEVVESCVNGVGVELNTASASLLSYVAGLSKALSKRIVARRNEQGPFATRRELLKVSGLGPKTFEQAAGFLRIQGAQNPLDASGVHPERYGLVETIAARLGVGLHELVGRSELVKEIRIRDYIDDTVGELTMRDIVDELSKPGRDPRQAFEAPSFRDDVNSLSDLTEGMVLEGVVTNVTAFGAFVDLGVHQDGLVHISQLADRFVRDPHAEVHAGQRLRVRVLSVDLARKRISLSAKGV